MDRPNWKDREPLFPSLIRQATRSYMPRSNMNQIISGLLTKYEFNNPQNPKAQQISKLRERVQPKHQMQDKARARAARNLTRKSARVTSGLSTSMRRTVSWSWSIKV